MKRLCTFSAMIILFSAPLFGGQYTLSFGDAKDWDQCLYDWKIDVTTSPDAVQLLRTELVADEMGVTTQDMGEIVSGNIRIKKEFLLEQVNAESAVLLIHCNSHNVDFLKKQGLVLWVDVNGNPVKLAPDIERMVSGGWIRCDIPVGHLKSGLNTFELRNETPHEFRVSVEASRIPNRSAKSIDGGKTWDYDHLGMNDFIDGEYLIRLRLGRYPSSAEIKSDFIETASLVSKDLIKPEVLLRNISMAVTKSLPPGTAAVSGIRGGKSPVYNPEDWGAWQSPENLSGDAVGTWKYFQWRVILSSSDRRVTPKIEEVAITADIDVTSGVNKEIDIVENKNQDIIRGYYYFAHQEEELERLRILRTYYSLDEVTAECNSQFQAIRTLAFWMRGIWRDGWHTEYTKFLHTPWNALVSLSMIPEKQGSGMCTIYGTTFVQCALSLGHVARGIVLDHHYISEVWIDDMEKWVVVDIAATTASLKSSFYEKDGVPLNSLEMHRLTNTGDNDKIWVVPAGGQYDKMNSADAEKYKMLGGIQWKPRFGMPLRNNFLTSLLPGELEHGFMQYHYDGYLWWKDSAIPKYEEYTYQSSHERDFYWTVNQAEIFPYATGNAGEIRILLDNSMPNFREYLVRTDGGEWKSSGSEFTWRLNRGNNAIEVKPVNKFGREGVVSRIILRY